MFLMSVNLCNVKISIMFTNLKSPPLYCWPVLSPKVYFILLCFHCSAMCDVPSFILGYNKPRGVFLENTWVGTQLKTFSLCFNPINCGKSTTYYKGFD